jgi:ABC-2 type transport system permease protein
MGKYLAILYINFRQQLSYKSELLIRGILISMFMLIFVALWTAIYSANKATDMWGFRWSQVMWYLVITEAIVLSNSRIFIEISATIKSGELAYLLIRPCKYLFYQISYSLGKTFVYVIVNFMIAAVIILPFVRTFETNIYGILGFMFFSFLSLLLDTLIALLIGMGAFFIEEVQPIYWVYSKLLLSIGGVFVPLEIFPEWLRKISAILPFQLIAYAPARIFVNFEREFFLRSILNIFIYIFIVGALISITWRVGKKRVTVHGG